MNAIFVLILGIAIPIAVVAFLQVFVFQRLRERWALRGITFLPPQSPRDLLVVWVWPILAGFTGVFTYNSWGAGLAFTAAAWLIQLIISSDLASGKIPSGACWIVFGFGLLGAALSFNISGVASLLAAFVFVVILFGLAALISRGKLGSGDFRLYVALTPLAAWVGYTPFLVAIFFAAVLQLIFRPTLKKRNVSGMIGVPYGPALVLGFVLAVAFVGHPGTPSLEWFDILTH